MKRIFMADDDADDKDVFRAAIAEIDPDCHINFSSDGFSLMKLLNRHMPPVPDLIFLDINMPNMNGHETIANIKKDQKYKNVPVIIYSTSNALSDINAMHKAGADYYIIKPDNFKAIKKVLGIVCAMDFGADYSRPGRAEFCLVA